MKKIYMILAALTLLSMSLNAQMMATKFGGSNKAPNRADRTTVTVASSDFSSSSGWTIIDANNDGSTWTISSGYAAYNYNQNNAANDWLVYSAIALEAGKTYTFNLDAWRRGSNYPEKLEVKFASSNTATALSAGTTIIAETTVTSTSQTSPNALSNTFTVTTSGNYYIGIHATSAKDMYTLYVDNMVITTESFDPIITASTNSVNLTATPNETVSKTITVTGENLTGDITATISGTDASLFSVSPATSSGGTLTITYSPTAIGTHTATLTLSSAGAQNVTVSLTGTCSNDITICDGTGTNNYLPIYGFYYDDVQINQMIYPSSLLTNLNGKKITSMTFYSPHLYFSGGKFTVKVGETNQASFSSAVRNTADLTATVVTDMVAPTAGGTELTITFATPFEYNGGNLLVDFEVTETGSYGSSQTSFYGITQTGGGFYSYASSGSSPNSNGVYRTANVQNFLPKVTFAVEESGPKHDLGIALSAPASIGAGKTATVTATVTNNGDFDEANYTVTIYANGTAISTQNVNNETLLIGGTRTFTANYATTDADAGTTVNFTATVTCTDDGDASNNNASASMSVITLPPPENVVATAGENQTATVTWDLPIIATVPATLTWDFEEQSDFNDFTTIDADGDGYNWAWHQNGSGSTLTTNTGDGVIYSESYHKTTSSGTALHPNNWLISPEVTLGGTLEFYACGQDPNQYWNEVFGVYVCVGSYNGVTDFVQVGADVTTTHDMTKYTYDLSQYQGMGYFAIVHHNVTDEFYLNVDDITYTYAAGNYPISYNVYLDGVLQGNVNSSTFSYDFSNLSSGQHECSVSAVYNEGESVDVPAVIPTFEPVTNGTVSPSSVDFGTQNIGGTYTATVTVTNTGNQSFTPTIDATGLPQGISVSPTTSGAVAPNGTLDLTVTFEPTAETNYSGTFTVTIPVPDDNDIVVTVTVTGSGYYASKLISNTTEEIPVFKSEAQAMDAIAYQVSDIDGDIKHLLPVSDGDGDVSIQVLGNSDITRYDLNRQSGSSSWSVVAVANHSGNDYIQQGHSDNTVTVANGATEWMNLIDDAGISSAEATYVPVTHALSIQQNDNTYGAPRQTKVNTDMSAAVQSIVMSSDYAGGQTWTENGKIYTHYTILLDINQLIIPTSDTDPTKDYDLYKVRAWRKVDPSLLNERYYAASTGNSGKNRQERLTEDGEFLFEELGYDEYSLVSVTNTNNKYYLGDNTDLESFYPNWTSRGTNEVMATFGAQKLRENEDETGVIEELSMVFTVRAYYTRTANLEGNEEPTRDGESAADGKYYILEYELPLTLHAYDDEVVTAVGSILADRQVVDVTYVNSLGMQSSEPFDGMNIVVTRYNDGSISTIKVIK